MLAFLANIKGQDYIPFPTSNTVWSEYHNAPVSSGLSSYYYRNIFSNKDTIIDAKIYQQLFYSLTDTMYCESPSVIYNGGIRESNRQVFYLPKDSSNEYLLYDFTVQVGDTLKYDYSVFSSLYGLLKIDSLLVLSIDSILILDGTYRKKINFSMFFSSHLIPNYSTFWIEGIGNNMGLLCPIAELPTNGINNILGCLNNNNEYLYYNNLFNTCYPDNVSVLEFSIQKKITINPNPVRDFCKIRWDNNNVQFHRIMISDIYGRIVFSEKIDQNSEITIDCRNFGQGMYLVSLADQIGRPLSSKLLIL